MSIEAMTWALREAPIPRSRRDSSSLAIVLVGLANHADPDGRNAFPSLATMTRYTRFSERAVRYALRALQELELIHPSDPAIVAAHVRRSDRRPNGYDLALDRTTVDNPVDNPVNEGQSLPPAHQHEGQATPARGANNDTARGTPCPRTVLNRPRNRPAPARRPTAAHRQQPLPPLCGRCEARPGDSPSARMIIDGTGRLRHCPRCHPRSQPPADTAGTGNADGPRSAAATARPRTPEPPLSLADHAPKDVTP